MKIKQLLLLNLLSISYGILANDLSNLKARLKLSSRQPVKLPMQRPVVNSIKKSTGLFNEVKVDLATAINETNFWLRQIVEHALFLHMGIVNDKLKNESKKIHKKLVDYSNKYKNPNLEYINKLLPLVKQLRDLQTNIIKLQEHGQWVGWLYPSLVKHMVMEEDYFVDKLNGVPYSKEDEANFWEKEASDRIGTIAHLLDPSEKTLVKEAEDISKKYFDVPETQKLEFDKSALEAVKAVNKYSEGLDLKNIKSIINKTLAEHEAREGKRGQSILGG